ncbi:DUF1549 and DUF1553 domain-containing protein [Schlesneria paludicola]|uniref:DUF1549 and DUF1553 domain-containing protein n=1 Tax=Schlesneria paludicola TaxID=360056 RepID=UPI00138AE20C|nr:DUF1549 and DUF1553 domain-containing protein [Schlesneria paludicola]
MMGTRLRLIFPRVVLVLALSLTLTATDNTPAEDLVGTPATPVAERKMPAADLARWIDEQFQRDWKQQGIVPAPLTNDSEFVRRAFLDLIGRIPSVAEVREFLDDPTPDKRPYLVEELLQRGAFANHLANTFRDLMLAGTTAPETRALAPSLEIWLKLRFTANMPYDQVVSELLTAPLDRPAIPRAPTPLAFYQAAEFKPEQLAANASRVFMGIQVQCAQCHDHPFAEWKQPQFWSFAAFFKNVSPQGTDGQAMMQSDDIDGIKIPGKDVLVPALFLDGSPPVRDSKDNRRAMLAHWVTSPTNPYFAKAAVNRVWGSYLGRGFVQPLDDLDPSHPPAYPEIFDALCTQFRLHHYDLKYLIRVIAATQVYQLSCRGAPREGEDHLAVQFARMPLRRLTSDQIYASFIQATGFREATPNISENVARDEFQEKFADSSVSPTEIKTTILQALSLMNGRHVTLATDLEKSEFLSVIAEAPFLDASGRIESLFLATLSRMPDDAERQLFVDALGTDESKAALADLFWMLLNSAEFLLNH